MPIRLVIADDHALLRQGIKNVLELESDLEVIGEAGDGEEALKLLSRMKPDILLLDINMPKFNGLEVARKLRDKGSGVKVIILTIHDDENYVLEVVKAGAVGYLLKDIDPGMLVKAIRTVYNGEPFIYPTLVKQFFSQVSQGDGLKTLQQIAKRGEVHLTDREVEVLRLIAKGMSNLEIANKLYLSEKTVKNHLTNIFRKVNVSDRTQAVLYAIRRKIVTLE